MIHGRSRSEQDKAGQTRPFFQLEHDRGDRLRLNCYAWLKEIVTMSQDDRNASAAVPCIDRGQLNSGIVVLSSTRKALYVNEAGQRLLLQLNRNENGHSAVMAIPRSVDHLLDEMLPLLQFGGPDRGWKRLEAKRLVVAPDRSVLVRTFGIPDRLDIKRSLIVLTIQETQAS
jgi:hypothetical protein